MGRLQHVAEKRRRIHQLQPGTLLRGPTSHEEQSTQAAGIELINFGNIEHEHANALELLDTASEAIERSSAYHASGAIDDRHIVGAFHLKLKFPMSVHKYQP